MVSLTHLIGAAAAGAVATAGFAGGSKPADAQGAVPDRYEIEASAGYPDIRASLNEQGFDVREYEHYARKIEVKGIDASGQCVEVYFHPTSGEELRRERDDDCGRGRDDDDDDRYDDDYDDSYGDDDDDDRHDDDDDDRYDD